MTPPRLESQIRSRARRLPPPRGLPALLCASLLIASPGLADAETGARPNLLLVTLDTTRADRFAAWGNRDGVTPAADRLAREGVVFERAVAPAPSTVPSHASMLSGLETARHGVLSNGTALPASVRTVTQALREAGYATGAFTSTRFLLVPSGLARGFDTANAPRERGTLRGAPATTKLALDWLRGLPPERPFFAWVHFFDAHSPYELTPWARERMGDYRGPVRGTVSIADFGLGAWIDDPADRRAVLLRYDGLVHRADASLGRLVKRLEAMGLRDRTVVIVVADHGQALGEHRHPGHAALWESILHVPLIVSDGRDRTPRRVRERVGIVDLAPTLLELAGVAGPAEQDGRSLVPALRGGPLAARTYRSRRPTPSEPLAPALQKVRDRAEARLGLVDQNTAVYRGDWKIIEGAEGRLVFDLSRDPGELAPIPTDAAENRATVSELTRLLEDAKSVPALESDAVRVPDETLEALRELGYVE